jgi:SSS family solute:Na+ symporter
MLGLGKVLYEYLQGVQGLLAPAIASVFLLGVFWRRTSQKGAFWGMISGFGLGMFRLVLNIKYGLVGKVGSMAKSILYINSDKARSDMLDDLSSVSSRITRSFPTDLGATLNEKVNAAVNAIGNLTAEGKAYASELLTQVKTGADQYYAETGGIIYKIAAINWLHYTVLLFFFCIVTMVVVSLLTKAPSQEQLKYTYAAASSEERAAVRASWNIWDVIHTIIILGVIVAFYFYFW